MGTYDDYQKELKAKSDKKKSQLKPKYIVVVIDPETGNQTDFTFIRDTCWTSSIEEALGRQVVSAMKRLSARDGNAGALED